MTWQPIETAPRDGREILVYFAGRLASTYRVGWYNLHGETTPENGLWCVDDEKNGPYPLRRYNAEDATHWQPLPPPPESEG